jgi:hypothetical protein
MAIYFATIISFFACKKELLPPANTVLPPTVNKKLSDTLSEIPPCKVFYSSMLLNGIQKSNPSGIPVTILLDFDGHTVTNSLWNIIEGWPSSFDCPASGLLPDVMGAAIGATVDDYSVFNVNIVTNEEDYNKAPAGSKVRCIITRNMEALFGKTGGIAIVRNFFIAGYEPVCFVFADVMANNPEFIGIGCSHETGHMFGLGHQSRYDGTDLLSEYHDGEGDGPLSWGPIMGYGLGRKVITWHNGPNEFGWDQVQHDTEILGNVIGMKKDRFGGEFASAAAVHGSSSSGPLNKLTVTDAINNPYDEDYIILSGVKKIAVKSHGNCDIELIIYDSERTQLAVLDDPADIHIPETDVSLYSGSAFLYYRIKLSQNTPFIPPGSGTGRYSLIAQF